jgi:hypothetical protein
MAQKPEGHISEDKYRDLKKREWHQWNSFRVSGNPTKRLKILKMENADSPIEINTADHIKKLPIISSKWYRSPLSPERNAIGSHTKSNEGLRHKSIKTKPTRKAFLEKPLLRTGMAMARHITSSRYGDAVMINCCQLCVIPMGVIHACPNSPSQKLGMSFM